MNFKRMALFFAFAFVCFSLYNQWLREHPKHPVPPVKTVLTAAASKTANAVAGDAPLQFVNHPKTISKTTATKHHSFITVKTDVLAVKIDLQGGNIVQTALPQYPATLKSKAPFILMNDSPTKRYIAQSGIVSAEGTQHMLFKAEKTTYTLGDKEALNVDLTFDNATGLHVVKRYSFHKNRYTVGVQYTLANHTNNAWQGQFYAQLSRLMPTEHHSFLQGLSTFTGAALSTAEKPYKKYSFKNLGSNALNQVSHGGWLAMVQQYFVSAWIPEKSQENHYYSQTQDDFYTVGVLGPSLSIAPGKTTSTHFKLYSGPQINERLAAAAPHLNLTIDFGWLWFISIGILWLIQKVHGILGNWGWAIVIVTFLIKLAFYKLSATSYRSMANMRKLQPKLDALKKRYADDKPRFSQEMMALYKKEKVNPLGGCLPMLVQIPVFIALYWVLLYSVQFRQAPFIFWIHDLAARDPYYILPIIMGFTMLIQNKLTPSSPDPMQAKMMMALPIVFTFLFLNFPSGLVLYWTVNNLLSVLQQWTIMRQVNKS